MNPLFALLLVLLLSLSGATQEIGTLTFREGALRVIRGSAVMQGTEGLRLNRGDIIESSEAGFAQLEFSGGTIVALGPSSGLFLFSHPAGRAGDKTVGKSDAELVLLRGWLKGETASNRTYRYLTPQLAATTKDGTIVLHGAAEAVEVYVESGSAGIDEVSPKGNLSRSSNAKSGQFFSRHGGKSVTAYARPDSTFVGSMPPAFRDTLPSRLSRFSGTPPQPKADHEVSYSEIEMWLAIAPAWRRGFVERFRPRLKDAAFRRALEDHLDSLPEWDPVLHPEKYKNAPSTNDKAESPPGRYLK